MDINVRLEGGAGDCLLGHRFSCAIKDKYPNSSITAYIDSEGKTFQKELLEILYPSFYKQIKIIPSKKYKKCIIDSQFGQEEYKGALANVPDEWSTEMGICHKFYDLHIDSLKWTQYDFDWLRYFRFFPKPEFQPEENFEPYVIFHLISSTNTTNFVHKLEQFYIDKLIQDTLKFIKVKIISTTETNYFYDKFKENPKVEILNTSLKEICAFIANAKCMVSVDSGFKYIGYSYSIPTICLGKDVSAPFTPFPSHFLRWMPFPESCFPVNFDAVYIVNLIKKILENPASILVPQLTDFNNQAIKRIYNVNQEKSILY